MDSFLKGFGSSKQAKFCVSLSKQHMNLWLEADATGAIR